VEKTPLPLAGRVWDRLCWVLYGVTGYAWGFLFGWGIWGKGSGSCYVEMRSRAWVVSSIGISILLMGVYPLRFPVGSAPCLRLGTMGCVGEGVAKGFRKGMGRVVLYAVPVGGVNGSVAHAGIRVHGNVIRLLLDYSHLPASCNIVLVRVSLQNYGLRAGNRYFPHGERV